ncbi:DUF4855 domain-containing protein [Oceanobacillus arenosus]|uniref:DUF4855 domain-containing protein n=1 Tax=Oceanobacillus arenosus TaxID=1229153 RepID=A0A3D8Q3A6_9BACI|nr:DUF4855 domain-containing protein [Oceanobacillus arenosus]RDW22189.1 DUF4855 domain-containing protein [Oceanobacillus arenosus]
MIRRKSFIGIFIAVLMLSISTTAFAKEKDEGSEYKNLASGLSYEISHAPESYIDSGNELTDGQYGENDFNNPSWQGHVRGGTRSVVFDLGKEKSIQKITANFLRDSKIAIFYPVAVSYYVSTDGEHWKNVSNLSSANALWGAGPGETDKLLWDGNVDGIPDESKNTTMAYARYVKVEFIPEMWAFIDEIEIWGYDEKVKGAKKVNPKEAEYLAPSKKTSNGIEDLVLLYNGQYPNGRGNWTKEKIMPYITYVGEDGEPQDWMYDGVLYLGIRSEQGRDLGTIVNPANKEDWQWYMDKTFAENGDLSQLNEATKEAAQKLKKKNKKTKVVLTVPYPSVAQSDFGDIDGDGVSENFDDVQVGEDVSYQNRKKAIDWYLRELFNKWNKENYSNLELSGIYWMNENVENDVSHEEEVIQYTSELVHSKDLKFYWIPNWYSNKSHAWEELGFDAAALQPNHFFYDNVDHRIPDGAHRAKQYGMGVEIEFDERLLSEPGNYLQKYLNYLNGGVDYGYMDNTFKAYYQGNDTILQAATSDDPEKRALYDMMYMFLKGIYTK